MSVRGTRAAATVIAARLRPGGLVQREMSVRTTGVFGHRLYAGITSGYFMALTVPLVKPDMILSGFFGRTAEGLELFGPERPPVEPRGVRKQLRAVATFANNQGLIDRGGNQYISGSNSGVPIVAAPQELGAGQVRSGALEQSNVDLSKEFVNLIISSTGFSAASRVITTSDQLITELLNSSR